MQLIEVVTVRELKTRTDWPEIQRLSHPDGDFQYTVFCRDNPNDTAFLAYRNREVVGLAILYEYFGTLSTEWCFGVFVAPSCRRQGIGRALFDFGRRFRRDVPMLICAYDKNSHALYRDFTPELYRTHNAWIMTTI